MPDHDGISRSTWLLYMGRAGARIPAAAREDSDTSFNFILTPFALAAGLFPGTRLPGPKYISRWTFVMLMNEVKTRLLATHLHNYWPSEQVIHVPGSAREQDRRIFRGLLVLWETKQLCQDIIVAAINARRNEDVGINDKAFQDDRKIPADEVDEA
jgi:hypothetical protein